jgi:N-acetyl-alpha-D-muramate 1-phosphate uridylyltransferase
VTRDKRDSLVAVVLAAGAGTRLRPLTHIVPKALCPINNVPLVDLALERASRVAGEVAVNVHHGRDQMEQHLRGRAHLSIEMPEPLGTAGALAKLRDWIDGRDVLVLNADSWHEDDLRGLLDGWDGERIRLLTVNDSARGDFGDKRFAGASVMPWSEVARIRPEPSGLYATSWAPLAAHGRLELIVSEVPFFDCGTLPGYHAANMAASGGENVIGPGAVVEGTIERTVLWRGVHVAAGEHLIDAIRPRDGMTLYATPVTASDAR